MSRDCGDITVVIEDDRIIIRPTKAGWELALEEGRARELAAALERAAGRLVLDAARTHVEKQKRARQKARGRLRLIAGGKR